MAFFCPQRLAMFIAHAFSHDLLFRNQQSADLNRTPISGSIAMLARNRGTAAGALLTSVARSAIAGATVSLRASSFVDDARKMAAALEDKEVATSNRGYLLELPSWPPC